MLNNYIIFVIIGIIFGYIIMLITSNIVDYHGYNSNDIRNRIYECNGIKYKLVPHVI